MKDCQGIFFFHSDQTGAMTTWHKDLSHFCIREQLHPCSTYAECLSYLSRRHRLQKWS